MPERGTAVRQPSTLSYPRLEFPSLEETARPTLPSRRGNDADVGSTVVWPRAQRSLIDCGLLPAPGLSHASS